MLLKEEGTEGGFEQVFSQLIIREEPSFKHFSF